jgi:hypothetical protein
LYAVIESCETESIYFQHATHFWKLRDPYIKQINVFRL